MENIILVSFFQRDSLLSYIYSNQQPSYMFQKDLKVFFVLDTEKCPGKITDAEMSIFKKIKF